MSSKNRWETNLSKIIQKILVLDFSVSMSFCGYPLCENHDFISHMFIKIFFFWVYIAWL